MATHPLGSVVAVTVTFRAVSGNYPKDPTDLLFRFRNPAGVDTDIIFDPLAPVSDPNVLNQVIRDFLGNYRTNVEGVDPGDYVCRYIATGVVIASQQLTFSIANGI